MKLYTKTGDGGETGLIGGRRVGKDDARVACYGEVDELNACVGLAMAACQHADWVTELQAVQSDLFCLGTQLATPDDQEPTMSVQDSHVDTLEARLDSVSKNLAPMENFVLPGGCELAARLHAARTICRRAERHVVSLSDAVAVDPVIIKYLNRLSDLLFAYALAANERAGVDHVIWQRQ